MADPGGGSGHGGWAARLMERSWGPWAVAAIGVGIVGRGAFQFVKVYTASFRDKIASYELPPRQERWGPRAANKPGLTAEAIRTKLQKRESEEEGAGD